MGHFHAPYSRWPPCPPSDESGIFLRHCGAILAVYLRMIRLWTVELFEVVPNSERGTTLTMTAFLTHRSPRRRLWYSIPLETILFLMVALIPTVCWAQGVSVAESSDWHPMGPGTSRSSCQTSSINWGGRLVDASVYAGGGGVALMSIPAKRLVDKNWWIAFWRDLFMG